MKKQPINDGFQSQFTSNFAMFNIETSAVALYSKEKW